MPRKSPAQLACPGGGSQASGSVRLVADRVGSDARRRRRGALALGSPALSPPLHGPDSLRRRLYALQ